MVTMNLNLKVRSAAEEALVFTLSSHPSQLDTIIFFIDFIR
jgi:hypothetical protein